MAMHQFKAESKKLLDLMINSIYTNREIFLRELISNASDACDKRYFKSLTDTSIGITKDDLKIHIQPDKDSRTLTITDNGIGMTKEELEKNLGTIARSGSLDFKTENQSDNIDIIGQFGVGFYSAFMVAKKVTVISRAQGADTAWKWESTGVEGYTLTEADKEDVGTEIILVLKDDTDTDKYSEYLEDYELANLVKKYSDYIRFPITMYREKSRQKPKPEDAGCCALSSFSFCFMISRAWFILLSCTIARSFSSWLSIACESANPGEAYEVHAHLLQRNRLVHSAVRDQLVQRKDDVKRVVHHRLFLYRSRILRHH